MQTTGTDTLQYTKIYVPLGKTLLRYQPTQQNLGMDQVGGADAQGHSLRDMTTALNEEQGSPIDDF